MIPFAILDPVLAHAAAAVVALVLVLGAAGKLKDLDVFRHALAAYELLPARLLPAVALGLPLLELAAGVLLLPSATRPVGALLALIVLLAATAAVVAALRAGRRHIDCGCGGSEGLTLSWGLVARNVVLVALAATALLPPQARATGWLDAAAAVAATLFFAALYAVVNQLLANQPRLRNLRNAP
jgi:hypothetical protein